MQNPILVFYWTDITSQNVYARKGFVRQRCVVPLVTEQESSLYVSMGYKSVPACMHSHNLNIGISGVMKFVAEVAGGSFACVTSKGELIRDGPWVGGPKGTRAEVSAAPSQEAR